MKLRLAADALVEACFPVGVERVEDVGFILRDDAFRCTERVAK